MGQSAANTLMSQEETIKRDRYICWCLMWLEIIVWWYRRHMTMARSHRHISSDAKKFRWLAYSRLLFRVSQVILTINHQISYTCTTRRCFIAYKTEILFGKCAPLYSWHRRNVTQGKCKENGCGVKTAFLARPKISGCIWDFPKIYFSSFIHFRP